MSNPHAKYLLYFFLVFFINALTNGWQQVNDKQYLQWEEEEKKQWYFLV